jgi:hypothetical protein
MHSKVLEARQRVLGLEHPRTLLSMNNLALALKEQGKRCTAAAFSQLLRVLMQMPVSQELVAGYKACFIILCTSAHLPTSVDLQPTGGFPCR